MNANYKISDIGYRLYLIQPKTPQVMKYNFMQNLVIVVMTMEEWFFLKDHAGKHTAKAPHIK